MSNERDELADLLCADAAADRVKTGGRALLVPVVRSKAEAAADKILAAGYRKPLTIENEKLVIDDGLLLLDVGKCTCSPYGSSHEHHCGFEYLDDLTKPLARAGYRKPRTVTTEEELDALPVGSVVLRNGRAFQRFAPRPAPFDEYPMWRCGDGGFVRSTKGGSSILPATVLHVGGAE